ncbi:MAG: hypothetical protein NTW21_10325 [Verrucomicrobia bacterium]|nr:hypothetical protein [Verrucomicrobiota bacterium]
MIYHCLSRVVDQRFAFGQEGKEKLRTFMRMYENFSGCRVLAYCFMQRFTQWFNRMHGRSGGWWEDAFKSVLVEDGIAARTMPASIDLSPVRAGMVTDPADVPVASGTAPAHAVVCSFRETD